MKRLISLLLVAVLLLSCLPVTGLAAAETDAAVMVESTNAAAGATVQVNLLLKNNPGIAGARVTVSYDDRLELIEAASGEALSALEYTNPGVFVSPCNFNWDSENKEASDDGVMLTLTFRVAEDAQPNSLLNVDVSYRYGDIYNSDLDSIAFNMVGGFVTVLDYLPGDVNGDGVVNGKDVTLVRRHNAGGYNISINESAADVNADGLINGKDVTLIRRYVAGDYDVELLPSTYWCAHELKEVKAQASTCAKEGNIAHWSCDLCGKLYADADGVTQITLEDTLVEKAPHTPVTDPAKPATTTSSGLTEGSHCGVCQVVLVPQEVIPPIVGYAITYNISNGDQYLAQLELDNSANPAAYVTSDKPIRLVNLKDPAGYKFLGWFDGSGSNADQVKEIPAGSKGDLQLYAHWQKEVYSVTFASDMVPVSSITYTTDQGAALPVPSLDKYTFVGWSDKDYKIWDEIPAGTAGDLILYANWSSYRNQAKAVKELGDPIILEDSENGQILFTYEIGTIENVPLFTTLQLQCVNGLITTVETTNQTTISKEDAQSVAKAISKATTNSASWTMDKTWNETTEVSKKTLDQMEITEEEAHTRATSSEGTFNIGTSVGGSKGNTKSATGSYSVTNNKSHSQTVTQETGQNFGLSVDGKYSSESSLGLSAEFPIKMVDMGVNASVKNSWEIGGGVDYSNYVKNTTSGTDSWSSTSEFSLETSATQTAEKNWNTDMGYTASKSASQSDTVSKAVSQLISNETGYGESYSTGGSNSESQEFTTSDSQSDEFSSALTYYNSEIKTTTTSFTSTGNTKGNYRMVMAGTVHVFGVVGYDVATGSYYVYTYSVLDEKTEEYLDYSYDGTFNDYETSIIPFEVPGFVNDFVNNRVAQTDGLVFDTETGTYVEYSLPEGKATCVVSVPSYYSYDKGDGTYASVKVTDISADLFRGNTTIEAVVLSHHIKEIPAYAFEGCTNLKYVICPGITKIGEGAFSGCTSLESFNLSTNIAVTEEEAAAGVVALGKDAFVGVPSIKVEASSAAVAKAVAASGAQNIVLDISSIPDADDLALEVGSIESFELWGKDKEYKGLSLKCDAASTVINGVTIVEGSRTPLDLSSEEVTLNRVSIASSGYAMLLKAAHTAITLNGTNTLSSVSGNTMICRDITLAPLNTGMVGKLKVAGKLLICGDIVSTKYLTADEIVQLTAEQFEQYSKGLVEVTLDVQGGTVSQTGLQVFYGQPYGTLPVPVRDYYDFDGWFTAAEGGTQVTAETMVNDTAPVTLYAQWSIKPLSDWVPLNQVPAGAAVVKTKWTYDQTQYTTAATDSMSGWTLYDSSYVWSDWGNWSSWDATWVSGDDGRQVESRTAYAYYYYVCPNCGVHMYQYGTCFSWAGGCGKKVIPSSSYNRVWDTLGYNNVKDFHGTGVHYSDNTVAGRAFTYISTSSPYYVAPQTQYRYRTRSQLWTYYFQKIDHLDAVDYPIGENISNIKEWVRYREK